jgi:hypothetical protein
VGCTGFCELFNKALGVVMEENIHRDLKIFPKNIFDFFLKKDLTVMIFYLNGIGHVLGEKFY